MTSLKLPKAAFFTIIILLILFLPLTGYSIYLKLMKDPISLSKDNVNKEMYFDGSLWFYNEKGEILGTYPCENEFCSYATSTTSTEYPLLARVPSENSYLPVINNRFVFLRDNATNDSLDSFLYDITNHIAFKEIKYLSVNNYEVGIQGNRFIVQNADQKYGVLQITDLTVPVISYDYDFIGALDVLDQDGQILGDYFVGLQGEEWKILDANGASLTSNIMEPIVTFNGEYIITQKNGIYHVMNYEGEQVLEENFKNLSFVDKYLSCQTEDQFYLYDFVTHSNFSEIYQLKSYDTVSVQLNENTISIYISNRLQETLSLS